MSHHDRYATLLIVAFAVVAVLSLVLIGCKTTTQDTQGQSAKTTEASQPTTSAKTGNELWATNCGQCHNTRNPGEFSDTQWAVIVHHMRVDADLTGQEQREITKFLQAAN